MSADIPQNPGHRSAWVQYELKKRGLSFAQIAREVDMAPRTIGLAMHQPLYRAEVAIAEALDLDPVTLFPERYDANGRRIHAIRGRRKEKARQSSKEQAA